MPLRNRYKERCHQADRIVRNGVQVEFPCTWCDSHGLPCFMDSKNRNCAACTRRGRKCEKRFHSDSEWDKLQRDEEKIAREIEETEEQIEQLFAKMKRLRKHRKFLKDRGGRMLDHDSNVLDLLDGEDPPSAEDLRELERLADEHDAAQLAAVSDDPSLTQLVGSPSFWANFDLSAGGTVPQAGDSPSNSR
jgi:Spy/CpxP family protein refolding chaperone